MKLSLVFQAATTAAVLLVTPATSATWNFDGVLTSSLNFSDALVGTTFSGSADVQDGGVAVSSLVLTLNTSEPLSFAQVERGTLFNFINANFNTWGLFAPISGPTINGRAATETYLYRSDNLGEPSIPPTFGDFKLAVEDGALFFDLFFPDEFQSGFLIGKITSIELAGTPPEITNVPAPLSAVMMLTGIFGLIAVRTRST